jgi:DNA-binding XRE family transcriptional regulator
MGGPQYSSRLRRTSPKTPNQIRRYRLQVALTQRELASRIGTRAATISSWERGRTCPAVPLVFRLAKTLDTLAEALYPEFYLIRGEQGTTVVA